MTACVQQTIQEYNVHYFKSKSNLLRNKSVNERGSNYDRQNRTNASLIFSNQKHESDLII